MVFVNWITSINHKAGQHLQHYQQKRHQSITRIKPFCQHQGNKKIAVKPIIWKQYYWQAYNSSQDYPFLTTDQQEMAYKWRDEIVGKRFLCVTTSSKIKVKKINEWNWRQGIIRASNRSHTKHNDLTVSQITQKYTQPCIMFEEIFFSSFLNWLKP